MTHSEILGLSQFLTKTAAQSDTGFEDEANEGLHRLGHSFNGGVKGQRIGAASGASLGLLLSLLTKHKGMLHNRPHTAGEDVRNTVGGGLLGAGLGQGIGSLVGAQKSPGTQ